MKLILLPLLTMMHLPSNLINNANTSDEVTTNLTITGKNGEDVSSKYKVEKIENSTIVKTTILADGDFLIEQNTTDEIAEQIVVGPNFNGSITIKNLKLFYTTMLNGTAPIDIDASSNVNLIIEGNNSIRAPQYYPAIGFYGDDATGTLTLSSETNGYLYALSGGTGAAAIGGSANSFSFINTSPNVGDIVINSGEYKLHSLGSDGPAIGSGSKGGHIKKIEINGGKIDATAYGATSGAGAAIGSGSKSSVDEIIINGGEIIATSNNTNDYNSKGAAIGAGTYGSVKKITINNGDIKTYTDIGVGIGGGMTYTSSSTIEKIEINGGMIDTYQHNNSVTNGIGVTDGSYNSVTNMLINGGSIKTNKFSTEPLNNNSDGLTLLNIPDLAAINYVKIDDVNFNIKSSKSENDLYLYLTRVDHSVTINNTIKDIEYFAKYIQESDTFILTKETEDETPPEEINTAPVIAATDISLKQGSEFNDEIAKTYATAYDEEEGNLTNKIEVIFNDVDTDVVGKYQVTYKVTDSKGAIGTKIIYVTVYADTTQINNLPVISGEDLTIEKDSIFNDEILKINVKAHDEEDGDLTARIQVVENNVNTSVIGKYTVKFMVEDNDNGISYYLINVNVVDTIKDEKPTIIANDITISINDEFNDDFILKNVQAFDTNNKDISDQIKIVKNDVDPSKTGKYELVFAVVDSNNNVIQKKIYVNVASSNDPKKQNNVGLIATLSVVAILAVGGITTFLVIYYKRKHKEE